MRNRSAESAQFAESVNGAAESAWHTAIATLGEPIAVRGISSNQQPEEYNGLG